MSERAAIEVYDTTLRDGAQQEGLSLSVADKLAIARHLDDLGVGVIEGGWPGAIPKDTEFFARAADELQLRHARLAAFGATRRAGGRADTDAQVRALLDARAPVVTLVAKSHTGHVERALRTTPAENLEMVRDSVAFLVAEGREVVLDAEHFFDGFLLDRAYALEVLRVAMTAGASTVALCDTNGGHLPDVVADVVAEVRAAVGAPMGIHCHNDTGCAVANTLAAVDAGAVQVQGTLNGYGERTGNADLVTVVANLELKRSTPVLRPGGLAEASRIAHAVSEITNVPPYSRQPYVGASAFTHKAGLHASAIRVDPDLYQHTDPRTVGNDMRMLVSEMAGRASIELKGRELGLDLSDPVLLSAVTEAVKSKEAEGYTFEAADASFDLLVRRVAAERGLGEGVPDYFHVDSWRVITEMRPGDAHGAALSEATVRLVLQGERCVASGEGNGPVNALDAALRTALDPSYPELAHLDLVDFRVRILDAAHGTDAVTRVLLETADQESSWTTVGVGPNVVEASWEALVDGLAHGLLRRGVPSRA
ncbi:citramalate synthase [Aquipuribacter nitratireducens]|uniref:Citramalate synthase n=1 Tax=Aquipuribacter nitratireducens TaxID=650104 RepID=A0ABW0GM43_9MICO